MGQQVLLAEGTAFVCEQRAGLQAVQHIVQHLGIPWGQGRQQGGVLACGFAEVAGPQHTIAHLLQCRGHGCELGMGGGHSFCRRSRALSKVSSFLAKQNRTTRWSNPSP